MPFVSQMLSYRSVTRHRRLGHHNNVVVESKNMFLAKRNIEDVIFGDVSQEKESKLTFISAFMRVGDSAWTLLICKMTSIATPVRGMSASGA